MSSKNRGKYRTAISSNGSLISIAEVERGSKEKFICPQCDGVLTPKKGKKNAHHFAHMPEDNCSFESYLHKISKLLFAETYTNCLENGKPFYLSYDQERECTTCAGIEFLPESCKLKPELKNFDLTKFFDLVSIEKGIKGFVADILLHSTKSNEAILIEFAVTHKCDESKIQSGLRIIEFQIEIENDLSFINHGKISTALCNYEIYNFQFNSIKESIIPIEKCSKLFETFIIYNGGNAIMKKMQPRNLNMISKNKNHLYLKNLEISPKRDFENFSSLVKEASISGVKTKNCFACRFSVKNENDFQLHHIWCKKHKAEVANSNHGNSCTKFWEIPKNEEKPIKWEISREELKSDEEFFSQFLDNDLASQSSNSQNETEKLIEKGFEIFTYNFNDTEDNVNCPMQNKLIPHTFCSTCAFSEKPGNLYSVACGFKRSQN